MGAGFGGVAGEFTRHDCGQVVVEWTGGERTRLHFFASRLKYFRYSLITPPPALPDRP